MNSTENGRIEIRCVECGEQCGSSAYLRSAYIGDTEYLCWQCNEYAKETMVVEP